MSTEVNPPLEQCPTTTRVSTTTRLKDMLQFKHLKQKIDALANARGYRSKMACLRDIRFQILTSDRLTQCAYELGLPAGLLKNIRSAKTRLDGHIPIEEHEIGVIKHSVFILSAMCSSLVRHRNEPKIEEWEEMAKTCLQFMMSDPDNFCLCCMQFLVSLHAYLTRHYKDERTGGSSGSTTERCRLNKSPIVTGVHLAKMFTCLHPTKPVMLETFSHLLFRLFLTAPNSVGDKLTAMHLHVGIMFATRDNLLSFFTPRLGVDSKLMMTTLNPYLTSFANKRGLHMANHILMLMTTICDPRVIARYFAETVTLKKAIATPDGTTTNVVTLEKYLLLLISEPHAPLTELFGLMIFSICLARKVGLSRQFLNMDLYIAIAASFYRLTSLKWSPGSGDALLYITPVVMTIFTYLVPQHEGIEKAISYTTMIPEHLTRLARYSDIHDSPAFINRAAAKKFCFYYGMKGTYDCRLWTEFLANGKENDPRLIFLLIGLPMKMAITDTMAMRRIAFTCIASCCSRMEQSRARFIQCSSSMDNILLCLEVQDLSVQRCAMRCLQMFTRSISSIVNLFSNDEMGKRILKGLLTIVKNYIGSLSSLNSNYGVPIPSDTPGAAIALAVAAVQRHSEETGNENKISTVSIADSANPVTSSWYEALDIPLEYIIRHHNAEFDSENQNDIMLLTLATVANIAAAETPGSTSILDETFLCILKSCIIISPDPSIVGFSLWALVNISATAGPDVFEKIVTQIHPMLVGELLIHNDKGISLRALNFVGNTLYRMKTPNKFFESVSERFLQKVHEVLSTAKGKLDIRLCLNAIVALSNGSYYNLVPLDEFTKLMTRIEPGEVQSWRMFLTVIENCYNRAEKDKVLEPFMTKVHECGLGLALITRSSFMLSSSAVKERYTQVSRKINGDMR